MHSKDTAFIDDFDCTHHYHNNLCKFCKGTNIIFDTYTGERICSDCGVVNRQSLDDHEAKIEADSKIFCQSIFTRFSKTYIRNTNVDHSGSRLSPEQNYTFNRLRRIEKYSINSKNEYRLRHASHYLGVIRDALHLPPTIIDSAYKRCVKILNANLVRGRSVKSFVVAAVYSICKEMGIPRTLTEISVLLDVKLSLARKCYKLLVEYLQLDRQIVEPRLFFAKMASGSGISNKTLMKALEVWSKIKDDPYMIGKKPGALAMTILYYASTLTGEKITKAEITSACGISIVTLNNRIQAIKEIAER